jgi:hypothetical protein
MRTESNKHVPIRSSSSLTPKKASTAYEKTAAIGVEAQKTARCLLQTSRGIERVKSEEVRAKAVGASERKLV